MDRKVPTLHPVDLNQVAKGSDYDRVVRPFFRNEAAKTIQKAFGRLAVLKRPLSIAELRHYVGADKMQQARAYFVARQRIIPQKLLEPIDDGFNQSLAEHIKTNRYDHIDYVHPDFTRRLFGALRAGVININEMMTTKLLHDSLLGFNFGEMPVNPRERFSRYELDDLTGPYQPSSIQYWDMNKQFQLEQLHTGREHYYTINLPDHYVGLFLYIKLNMGIIRDPFDRYMSTYIESKASNPAIKSKALFALKSLDTDRDNSTRDLLHLISSCEPRLNEFLRLVWAFEKPELILSNNDAIVNRELQSIQFLIGLDALSAGMPGLCISPQFDPTRLNSPVLSFVLPTVDAFNTLQKIVHGTEATIPTPVVGEFGTRLIRAFDEIPVLKNTNSDLTEAQALLNLLYPMASELDQQSRPIELTHPDIKKFNIPHDYDCSDFLLSWHDLFHAWQNGTNYKFLPRKLKALHDEKAGYAENKTGMSKAIWALTDLDTKIGLLLRRKQSLATHDHLQAMFEMFKLGGFDFMQTTDNNFLLSYALCKFPKEWESSLFNHNPLTMLEYASEYLNALDKHPQLKVIFNRFISYLNKTQDYLQNKPNATVVELILHELLGAVDHSFNDAGRGNSNCQQTTILNEFRQSDYKNLFYWSKNGGLRFKAQFQPFLNQFTNVNINLSDNSSDVIRQVFEKLLSIKSKLENKRSFGFFEGRVDSQSLAMSKRVKSAPEDVLITEPRLSRSVDESSYSLDNSVNAP